ncbi:MAG: histidinol-phosphatase [Actinobacteria bacterium]|nr:histidinol-phosphatase [Actinomycetota bacterium]
MLVDYHLHLRASVSASEELDHTVEAVERYVERALERGVDEIGITEHVYYFIETRPFWALPYQLDRCREALGPYCDAVLEAKRRGLPVKLGLEVDWVPDRADDLAAVLEPFPWDYLVGSVHWIGGLAVDQKPGLWADRSVEEVWALYTRELEAAARSGHFDVLAHPDLVKIFGDRVEWDWQPVIDALDGVALEVSTAGLHKPVGELYPEARLLRGASRITVASDAHLAEDVGRDFEAAVEHARRAGFETVTVFDGRSSRQEPLG